MALGSITIDLLLKTGAFNSDAKLAERRLKDLGNTAKAVGTVIGVAFAGAVTASAIAIKSAVNRMDEMSKAAQRAQIPTEEFSQLAYAGSLADVAMQDITTSMGRLAKAQGDAAAGGKAQIATFKALGLEVKNADGSLRNTHDLFLDFADVFQKNRGSPEILALGMQLFGRSFQNLIPLLKDGKSGLQAAADEADRLGVTLGTEAGQKAEEFNDNITRVKAQIDGLWQGIAIDLMPDLIKFSEQLNSQSFKDGFSSIINGAVTAAKALANFAVTTANVMNFLGEEAAARMHGAASDDIVRLEAQAERIKRQLETSRKLGAAGADLTDAAREFLGLPTTEQLRIALANTYRDIDAYRASPAVARISHFDASGAGVLDASTGSVRIASTSADKSAAEAKKALSEANREAEKSEKAFTDSLIAGEDARIKWVNRIADARAEMAGPAAEAALAYKRALAEANAAMALGHISADEHGDYVETLADRYRRATKVVEESTDEMAVFADQARRNIQTNLGDSLYNALNGRFEGIADSFADMLKRMAAELMASQVLKFFMGSGSQGGLFDLYSGSGFGFASGGYTGNGAVQQPAGIVHKGEVVWSQADIAKAGGVGVVESMRRGLRGYATGGVVGGGIVAGGGMRVEIVNNGPPVKADGAEFGQGMDGEQLIKVFLSAVADDTASGGRTWQATKMRGGLKDAI